MRNRTVKALALVAGAFLFALALSAPARASSLRQGATAAGGAVTGSLPGQVLWTYYQTFASLGQFCPPGPGPSEFEDVLCNTEGEGDNIIRLINPNGSPNGNLGGASQTVCAMIYVFDDDQEMGACCGCPLSSAQLATFSVGQNLTSNWSLPSTEVGTVLQQDNAYGAIAIVAAGQNAPISFTPGLSNGQGCESTQSGACNLGCDPANIPGYRVTIANNLLGSITHNQSAQAGPLGNRDIIFGITETALSDDGGGDPTDLIYLQNQCGALVGNSTGGGICNCPIE